MAHIEAKSPAAFHAYLQETRNTICGRHPIHVLLYAATLSRTAHDIKFTQYAQSSPARTRCPRPCAPALPRPRGTRAPAPGAPSPGTAPHRRS